MDTTKVNCFRARDDSGMFEGQPQSPHARVSTFFGDEAAAHWSAVVFTCGVWILARTAPSIPFDVLIPRRVSWGEEKGWVLRFVPCTPEIGGDFAPWTCSHNKGETAFLAPNFFAVVTSVCGRNLRRWRRTLERARLEQRGFASAARYGNTIEFSCCGRP